MWPFEKKRIEVRFQDGRTDAIHPSLLNTYIEMGKIVQFRRSHGWVRVGSDPIRGHDGGHHGEERRRN